MLPIELEFFSFWPRFLWSGLENFIRIFFTYLSFIRSTDTRDILNDTHGDKACTLLVCIRVPHLSTNSRLFPQIKQNILGVHFRYHTIPNPAGSPLWPVVELLWDGSVHVFGINAHCSVILSEYIRFSLSVSVCFICLCNFRLLD